MARIVIASGGTGGHFYPGFSLGQALRKKGHDVVYVVRLGDPALPLLEGSGFPAIQLDLTGLPRRPGVAALRFLARLTTATFAMNRRFAGQRPDAVVGMGAYLSFPVVAAAWMRRVPVIIHESNADFGLANKVSRILATEVCLGLPMDWRPDGPKVALTGTPIREALWQQMEPGAARLALGLEREKPTVLVFGGSQGASKINAVAPGALALASDEIGGLQVLHLSGAREQVTTDLGYQGHQLKAVVLPYLESMELAFGAADLVISRSGASTLAELIAQRKPAILVPYPFATGAHQTSNARRLEKAGAATVLMEESLTEAQLAKRVAGLLKRDNAKTLESMRKSYDFLSIPTGKAAVDALVGAVEGSLESTK